MTPCYTAEVVQVLCWEGAFISRLADKEGDVSRATLQSSIITPLRYQWYTFSQSESV